MPLARAAAAIVPAVRRCRCRRRRTRRNPRSRMPLDWGPFADFVRRHRRFLLTTHVRPDGDGLGSMLALADALEAQGKAARMVVASTLPPRYGFLDPGRRIRRFALPGEEYRDADAV